MVDKNLVQINGNLDNKFKMVSIHQSFKDWADNYKYDLSDKDLEPKLKNIFKV